MRLGALRGLNSAAFVAVLGLACALPPPALAAEPPPPKPLVIAHRGASGYLPEHTLGGYEYAIRQKADYIEPDLQLTKDGQLVALHDDSLERTTDVARLFARRNGAYKVADFTLAEIKTLTVRPTGTAQAAVPGFEPTAADPWRVPTFGQVLELAAQAQAATGRTVGVYPEAKKADPAMEDAILDTLAAAGITARSAVFVQSFSDATLESLRRKAMARHDPLPQILLGRAIVDADGTARMGVFAGKTLVARSFAEVARFADGVGVQINAPDHPLTPAFVAQAHAAGLQVHAWTFAQPDPLLAEAEYRKYIDMGVDGLFSNYPDLAIQARDRTAPAK